MIFDVIILAGGRGERLRPLTDYVCKPMIKVCDKPILQWQLEHIQKFNPRNIYIVGGYRIKDIPYPAIDNTGKSQVQAVVDLKNKLTDNFFVIYGDIIFFEDLKEMLLFHVQHNAIATIKYHEKQISSHIIIDDDMVVSFEEHPFVKTNSCIYCFNKEIFNYISPTCVHFPRDVFPRLPERFFYALPCDKYRISIDTVEQLDKANKDLIDFE